jgi:hypothetical protein
MSRVFCETWDSTDSPSSGSWQRHDREGHGFSRAERCPTCDVIPNTRASEREEPAVRRDGKASRAHRSLQRLRDQSTAPLKPKSGLNGPPAMFWSSYIIGCLIDHFARDTRIFNFRVPIGEAAPLFFFLLRRRDFCSRLCRAILLSALALFSPGY